MFQNHEHKLINSANSIPESVQNQQNKQTPVIIQKHQLQKPLITSPTTQIIHKDKESSQNYTQQLIGNRRPSQTGTSQQISNSDQIIPQVQYLNQVTVIDGFSPPNGWVLFIKNILISKR